MNRVKKVFVAAGLFIALGLSTLVATGNVPRVYANFPPPGGGSPSKGDDTPTPTFTATATPTFTPTPTH